MVKRFHDPGDWMQSPTGEYVLASDYDALAAELRGAKSELAICEANRLCAHNVFNSRGDSIAELEETLHRAYNAFENITVAETLNIAQERAHELIFVIDSIGEKP